MGAESETICWLAVLLVVLVVDAGANFGEIFLKEPFAFALVLLGDFLVAPVGAVLFLLATSSGSSFMISTSGSVLSLWELFTACCLRCCCCFSVSSFFLRLFVSVTT